MFRAESIKLNTLLVLTSTLGILPTFPAPAPAVTAPPGPFALLPPTSVAAAGAPPPADAASITPAPAPAPAPPFSASSADPPFVACEQVYLSQDAKGI